MNNNPMQDPDQSPFPSSPEPYGAPNYYPPQQPPYPQQSSYPQQPPAGYPPSAPDWNTPPSYPSPPTAPAYPAPGYPQPGYLDATQPAYGQSTFNYSQPAPGYPNPYPQAGPNYPDYPNYYAAPPVARRNHTGRNILIALVVFVVIIGGAIGLVALLHRSSTPQITGGPGYPSYLPGHGTLALNDSLQNAENWSNTNDGHCVFDSSTFHVRSLSTDRESNCWSHSSNTVLNTVSNSAFEAQMKIVQGDCGGLDIRSTPSAFTGHHKFYLFSVCQDGNFGIFKYNVNALGVVTVLDYAHSAAINQGLNVSNTLDFVASGSALTIFINAQKVASVQDSALTEGAFGLDASPSRNNVTDVSYSNARVWTL